MKPSDTYTIHDLINIGNTIELTYYKTSTHQLVNNIECSTRNIFYDYLDQIMDKAVTIELTSEEYNKYIYRPKLLSYDIYRLTDLYYIILMLNNINSEKDFDFKTIKLLKPEDIDILNNIYNSERKYILLSQEDDKDSLNNNNYNNLSPISSNDDVDKYMEYINEIRYDINNIKTIIRDLVEESINDEIKDIMKEQLDLQIEEIKNMLDEFTDQKINDRINDFLNSINNLRNDLENKIDIEIDYIYEELYDIRNLIGNIISDTQNPTIDDILNRLTIIENTLDNLINLVNTIIDEKIDDRLEIIMNRIERLETEVPNNMRTELDELKIQVNNINSQIESVLSNNYTTIVEKLKEDFYIFKDEIDVLVKPTIIEEIDKFKEQIININNMTRDIVFNMIAPLDLGIQQETVFTIPYIGTIKQLIVTIGIESTIPSNIIVHLERYDTYLNRWIKVEEFNVFAGEYFSKFDLNIPVDKDSIRFFIENGDLYFLKSIAFILKVLESE